MSAIFCIGITVFRPSICQTIWLCSIGEKNTRTWPTKNNHTKLYLCWLCKRRKYRYSTSKTRNQRLILRAFWTHHRWHKCLLFRSDINEVCIVETSAAARYNRKKGVIYMKKISLILGIIFLILTFVGGAYVLINHGQVSAGYAVIPALWCMICFGYYRSKK